jgi:hypothetical protein
MARTEAIRTGHGDDIKGPYRPAVQVTVRGSQAEKAMAAIILPLRHDDVLMRRRKMETVSPG